MKTVEQIIETLHNGGEWSHIKVENDPYMPLVIEAVGRSPQGLPLISVAHYFEQNGDLCQDPEMVFEVGPAGWLPVFFQQAIPPIYREAIVFKGGKVLFNPREMKDQKSFARVWDRNLKHQGFLKQAQLMAPSYCVRSGCGKPVTHWDQVKNDKHGFCDEHGGI